MIEEQIYLHYGDKVWICFFDKLILIFLDRFEKSHQRVVRCSQY